MKYLLPLFLFSVLFAQDTATQLVGRWRSAVTSQGGLGSMVQLQKDGTLEYSKGAIVEMKYRVEGKSLVLPPENAKGPETRQAIEFVGDKTLRMMPAGAPPIELARQGNRLDAANPILGEWTAPREVNGKKLESRYIFYPSGKALLLLPIATKTGVYSVQGAKMKIDIPGLSSSEGSFQRAGDALLLPMGKAGRVKYLRY